MKEEGGRAKTRCTAGALGEHRKGERRRERVQTRDLMCERISRHPRCPSRILSELGFQRMKQRRKESRSAAEPLPTSERE
eukprot:scaffold85387_cov32-Tisochrysis_lutea.AAC.1